LLQKIITLEKEMFEKLNVGDIGFEIRVVNIFYKHGINTGKDLLNYKMSELTEFSGFGLACEKDVEFVLQEYEQSLEF
jgi:hypothetical protein